MLQLSHRSNHQKISRRQSMSSGLQQLPHDVLRKIVVYAGTSAQEVIRCGGTCRALRRVAQDDTTWDAVFRGLSSRSLSFTVYDWKSDIEREQILVI